MQASALADRQYYAAGVAARHIGTAAEVYRPASAQKPLSQQYRVLRLKAAFLPARGGASASGDYDAPQWHGIFDASYTAAGDYLVTSDGVFFIASQWPLLPVLCVRTNRVLAASRPAHQAAVGSGEYGGYSATGGINLFSEWPASVLGLGRAGDAGDGLPVRQPIATVTILLPKIANLVLQPGDLLSDDLGRSMMATATELTELGWRLSARLVSA